MSTPDTTPTQGGIPPGSGEPGNRRGQQDPAEARAAAAREAAAKALTASTSILSDTVKQLGGWVKNVATQSVEGVKEYLSGGATTILEDIKSSLTAEIHEFGYLGQKFTQATDGAFNMLKGAMGSTKTLFSHISGKLDEKKEAENAMKEAAMAKADGDMTIYHEELKRLKEEKKRNDLLEKLNRKNTERAAKIEEKIQKENQKLLNAKSDSERLERIEKIKLLEQQKEATEALLQQAAAPAPSNDENTGGECNSCEKLDTLNENTEEARKAQQQAAEDARQTAERHREDNERRFQEAQDNESERHSELLWAGIKNALTASLPGWLTVGAVGGLLLAVGGFIYSRWPEMVQGFKYLMEDITELRDKVTMAINDGIEKVMKWGGDLLNWANNLLPTFVEWWKMNMPNWMGGYDDDTKQQIRDDQQAAKDKELAAEKQASAAKAAAAQQAELQRQASAEDAAAKAETLKNEAQKIKDETEKADKQKTGGNNTSTVIKGGDTTAITQAASAGKPSAAAPVTRSGPK